MTAGAKMKTARGMGIVLCVLLGAVARAEDPVQFDDPKLKAAVELELGVPNPTPTHMLALTSLSASYLNISSLTGLEYAANLEDLDLEGNRIRYISALSGLANLEEVNLSNNDIGDIYALTGLTHLLTVDLRGNILYSDAYTSYIPQIIQDNPGITIYYDRAPEVSTYTPSQVTETSALLEAGLVDDGGLVCEYRFRYWQEGRAEQFTEWTGSVTGSDPLIERVTGLTPGRLYHVEAQARNAIGSACGDTRDFSTIPAGFVTLSSAGGGDVLVPGEGRFMVRFGTVLRVVAMARRGWRLLNWTGTAVEAGKVEDPNSAATNVVLDGDYTLCARFVILGYTAYVDDDAAGDPGPGDPLVSDPNENGSLEHPFDSIQEAVDSIEITESSAVVILAGTYTGPGNREIDFGGRPVVVRGADGPGHCVIDCQGQGRAFTLHSGEGGRCAIEDLTIVGGFAQDGGALYVTSSSATIRNCMIKDCRAVGPGGGVFCGGGVELTLEGCTLTNNQPDAVFFNGQSQDSKVVVEGTVRLAYSGLAGQADGVGKVVLNQGSTLEVRDSNINCRVIGSGTLWVPGGSRLTMVADGFVRLTDEQDPNQIGLFQCDGTLYVQDRASVWDTTLHLAEAYVGGDAVLSGNRITIDPKALTGIRVSGAARLENNTIRAGNDQYLTLDPLTASPGPSFTDNTSLVTIDRGTVFEVRALDPASTGQGSASGVFELSAVPDFNAVTWTIDRLHVQAGQRLRLADRFGDQQTSPRQAEVVFVRELILEANAILDLGQRRVYYGMLMQDPTAQIVNQALLGFSLGTMEFGDPNEYVQRAANNNTPDRTCVERVTGQTPDPNGMMRLGNLHGANTGPQTAVYARAKVRFAGCVEDQALVRFGYLFGQENSGLELVVWLSDAPELLDSADLTWASHCIEVGHIGIPASEWPGAPGSGQFGQYEQRVSTLGLDLSRGTWIELELVGPAAGASAQGASVVVDDLAVDVFDCGGLCVDLNWDSLVNEGDFMSVMAVYGQPAGVTPDLAGNLACMEGVFSRDGTIDCYDVFSWDWALKNTEQAANACEIPLASDAGAVSAMALVRQPRRFAYAGTHTFGLGAIVGAIEIPGQLLILGKRGASEDPLQQKLEDRAYMFDEQGRYGLWLETAADRCNQRMVRDGASLYLLNSQTAVCRLREGGVLEPVVPPGQVSWPSDPRYGKSATITIGLQQERTTVSGRPVSDAAFSGQYGYVAPVVVSPEGGEAYLAAAKLELRTSQTPPYRVVQLYDDPGLAGGGQSAPYLNGIREIEVDSQGTAYVTNADGHTYSDILWAHRPDGKIQRVVLDQLGIDAPIGLCVSNPDKMVYVGSGCADPTRTDSTAVYGFSTEDLGLRRTVTIRGMQFVTAMVAHPRRNVVWVVGLTFKGRPSMPSPSEPAFYRAYLAVIQPGQDEVQAIPLTGTDTTIGSDLALPTSIVWTGF